MRKERERAARRRRNGITVGIVVIVLVLVGAASFGVYQATSDDPEAGGTPDGVTDKGGVLYTQEVATGKSSSNADPVEVVAYEDFYCPACRSFEETSGQFLQSEVEKGTVSVEYRPVAILDNMGPDQYSTRSAAAAACVVDNAGAEAFYKFHKSLYANQPPEGSPGLTSTQLNDYAEEAGADGVRSCISDEAFKDWVADQTQQFAEDGHQATPTILVDGEPVSNPSPESLAKAIKAAA